MARIIRKTVSPHRRRVIIEAVTPEVDCGRFAAKRIVGDVVEVSATAFTDGHDALACRILFRHDGDEEWTAAPMRELGNDRWQGSFPVGRLGDYHFTVQAWIDDFGTWRRDMRKRVAAGQDVSVDLLIGAEKIAAAARRAKGDDGATLRSLCKQLQKPGGSEPRIDLALSTATAELMHRYPDLRLATTYERELPLMVERKRARFSTWYELFPRSATDEPGRHGTFADVEKRLSYVAEMGFDVLYLPPIHPIGTTQRKGRNNALTAMPSDPGSPWAIGSPDGGHRSIHPALGTLVDFHRLIDKAAALDMEIALDIAFQCSPDHPYVQEHPEWFRKRPDGSIQFAENPPKKYEDIYPFDFDTAAWKELWEELTDVVRYWVKQGVRIFRVDNPHTKSLPFWEYLIHQIRSETPEVLFLAEAFTRPHPMYYLAKLGFSQSYNYFPWRNAKWELEEYFSELTQTGVKEFFRPNLWPNTPDILTEYLQHGGPPAFSIRLILAATLGASYGIYGPAFELQEHVPRQPGSEEYLDSEKYEIRQWDLERPDSLRELISLINSIRRTHPALQQDHRLTFHGVDNDQLLCFSKQDGEGAGILVVVNLSPHHTHAGWVTLQLDALGITQEQSFQVHDLLSDARYLWQGERNFVELNPQVVPAHIFSVQSKVRQEEDFEYYEP